MEAPGRITDRRGLEDFQPVRHHSPYGRLCFMNQRNLHTEPITDVEVHVPLQPPCLLVLGS